MSCPECREETRVPGNGVGGLKSAFYINRLLGIVGEPRQEGNSENPQPRHQSSGGQERKCCSKHASEELTLYCEACGELICWKCAYEGGEHHTHHHQLIDEAFKKYQEEISSSQKLLERQMFNVTEALESVNECHVKIGEQYENIAADIDQDARKIQLISQLENLTITKLESLSAQQRRLKLNQIQLKSCLDFIKNSMHSNSPYEILEIKASVMNRIRELTLPPGSSDCFDVDYVPEATLFKG